MRGIRHVFIVAGVLLLAACPFDLKYTVSGTVSGLEGTGMVIENNAANGITITANGSFTFSSSIAKGAVYAVTVSTQPTPPSSYPTQTCTVHNGTGTMSNFNVTNVLVTCTQAGRFVYVVNQTDATISEYQINASNPLLSAIAASPTIATNGTSPIAVAADPNHTYLYAVNSGSNTVSTFSIDYLTGTLTLTNVGIATGNAPSAIAIDPGNRFMFVTNSTDDTVSAYTLSAGVATAVAGSPFAVGDNPFSVTTDPGGNFLYVANYNDGTITAFSIDPATGVLTLLSGSPFGDAGAGVIAFAVNPSGTYAYAASEKNATITPYTVSTTTGTLVPGTAVATSSSPESLAVTPNGNYLYAANVTSADQVTPYSVGVSTGALTAGTPVATGGVFPVSMVADPSGAYAYVVDNTSNTISMFSIDASTGALAAVSGSPFAAGGGARAVAVE